MRTIRLRLALALLALVFAGCSAQRTKTYPDDPPFASIFAPSDATETFSPKAVFSVVPGLGTPAACTPTVTWDPAVYGRVTVRNGATPCDYVFIVWDATVYENQINLAEVGHTYAANETFTLTLNYQINCGRRYQRDLYAGVKPSAADPLGRLANRYTESDLRNYFEQASGIFAFGPACDAPPPPPVIPPPPPGRNGDPVCTVPSATNFLGPLPCVFAPPPPVDVCPNLEGIQPTVPVGRHLSGGICVLDAPPPPPLVCLDATATNFGGALPCVYPPPPPPPALWCHVADVHSEITENTQSLPPEAIQNGHVGPDGLPTDSGYPHPNWRHELDYPGTCDGRSLQVLQ